MSATHFRIFVVAVGLVVGVVISVAFGLAGFVVTVLLAFVAVPLLEARRADRPERDR